MKYLNYFQYNSFLILTFFLISLFALILNKITNGKSNKKLFSSYRNSLFSPLTYVRLFTHVLGHENWNHFVSNFLYILLIGPMIEEKYGTMNVLIMILITGGVTGIINSLLSKKRILGASGIVFMFIVLSSFVNIASGKIPLTLVLICLFYIVNEVKDGLLKNDRVSHMGHLLGAICGCIYGFYIS